MAAGLIGVVIPPHSKQPDRLDLMAKGDAKNLEPDTLLAQGGRRPEWTGHPDLGGSIVNPPVWRASTILYDNMADLKSRPHDTHNKLYYGRRGTPTVWALADALTDLEPGAEGTLLYSSGVQAIAAGLTALLQPGDHLLMVDSAYQPTRSFCDGFLKRMGVETTYYDPMIGGDIAALCKDNSRLIFMESPGSHSFEVQDIPAIVAVAKARGITTFLDNTWATSLFLPALAMGVDVAMMACTKYVVGHSDVMLGSLTTHKGLWQTLRRSTYEFGYSVSPDDCYLALRGLRTMGVRLRQHQESALQIARWLEAQSWVSKILHPAFPDCPGHEFWKRDFKGASGLFSFGLKGATPEQRDAFIDALQLFGLGYSWGGFESVVVPSDVANLRTATTWSESDPFVRLHIGLEDPADLIADLEQAAGSLVEKA